MKENRTNNMLYNFLWYCSGLKKRELVDPNNLSNYFGLGSINIFSSLFMLFVSILAFQIAFPGKSLIIFIAGALVIGVSVFSFNRQTIRTISASESKPNPPRRHTMTILPIFLYAFCIGMIISTPIKFYLFDIPINGNFLSEVNKLQLYTNLSISAKISSWSVSLIIMLLILLPTIVKLYTSGRKHHQNRSSIINELMWFCSGANKEILRQCPTEYSKYFGIGGTILFTALMATMSGGYAFYTAFGSSELAILFGLFWGAMIFNLDRYIVNTIFSDGTVKITKGEILAATPRLIIAIFLGIVITLPLELRLFEDQINVRIESLKNEELIQNNKLQEETFGNSKFMNQKIDSLNKVNKDLNMVINQAMSDYQAVPDKAIPLYNDKKERIGTKYIKTQEYYNKLNYYNKVNDQNEQIVKRNDAIIATEILKVQNSDSIRSSRESEHKSKVDALNDLSTRMEAFDKLKQEKPTVRIASWFIMLLLIIIEISPVLFKLMTESGPYDDILATEKHIVKVRELKRISDVNDEINTEISINIKKNEGRMGAEVLANEELLNAIALAQAEIANVAIEKWKENEIKKATDNPESIIKSTNSIDPEIS